MNNKLLTLEELREMDLKPVWVQNLEYPDKSQWRLCHWDRGKYLVLQGISTQGYLLEDYGETWVAYASEPPRLDRSAWEPCEMCGDKHAFKLSCNFAGGALIKVFGESLKVSSDNKTKSFYKDSFNPAFWINFCPWCGRPLTDAAWETLEKRLEINK